MLIVLLGGLALVPAWRGVRLAQLSVALERARMAADDPAIVGYRVSGASGGVAARVARAFHRSRSHGDRLELAAHLSDVGQSVGGHRGARAVAIAHLVARESARAGDVYASLPATSTDAHAWNDLAAVQGATYSANGSADALIAALAAADRALALEPDFAEARFNRAAIVDAFGIPPVAFCEWSAVRARDSSSEWAAVAQQHLTAVAIPESARWESATANLDAMTATQLAALARELPEAARRHAEGLYLYYWAASTAKGDSSAASRWLERARLIGEVVRRERGDTLIVDSIAAIEGSGDRRAIADAYVAYGQGRSAYKNGDLPAATAALQKAARAFAAAKNPMQGMAEVFMAAILTDDTRIADAAATLKPPLDRARRSGTHKALLARILLQMALCDANRGHWSDSLAAAHESAAISRGLKEPSAVAAAEAVLSEDYDYLGRPDLARRYGLSALRGAFAYGDLERPRPILAAMARTELRGGRWQWARSLIQLETSLRPHSVERPDLDADMLLRAAAAEFHLGHRDDARQALLGARNAARNISEDGARGRLTADIDGVEGAMLRVHDPLRAYALLSSAIAFQQRAERPYYLPELYLERARAAAKTGRLDAAQRDLDDGIRELERQRSGVHDAEARPGIFDDAEELFDEAVALQLRRGAPAAEVLAYVERGRARTVLEQLQGDVAPPVPEIGALQRRIGPRRVLVEYVALPDRLVIFTISSDDVRLHTVDISRDRLAQMVDELVNTVSARDLRRTQARSARLFSLLIEPIRAELRASVVIAADDVLQRVPFAALYDDERERYLIEQRTISYTPSAGVFMTPATKMPAPAAPSLLAFANPDIPRHRFPGLASLDASEREAAAVARSYEFARIFRRAEATAARFLELAPQYDFIHFGGHGVNSRHEPASSELICADDGSGARVTAREIARMRFVRTRAVVLAACSTMTGPNAVIEGVPSLGRAFLVAGVPEVVGTLWDIQDRDAAPLMRTLHAHLARGTSASAALRIAQIEAIRSDRPERRHPHHWAAFTVMGTGAY